MLARYRKLMAYLSGAFWVLPALLILCSIVLAQISLGVDGSGIIPAAWLDASILYNGGGTGARTLLGAIATSTIGVAGTIFSITIAALTLAAGQMGPRLLRNFTRDRGNQATLGIYLGTFAYSLVVLRSVRTAEEGVFVPHLALTLCVILAFLCVATLVYFVAHIAGRINVDTVIDLVARELHDATDKLLLEARDDIVPSAGLWDYAGEIQHAHAGYLQHLDAEGLADWAAAHGTAIRLLVRPGQFVFPGAPIALAVPPIDGLSEAVDSAVALGSQRTSSADLEQAARQLAEVAVRALSPGINDPQTAISVIDRLGASLCEIARLYFPSGVIARQGQVVLVVPVTDYAGLVDTMFNMIRQSAAGNAAVLIRMLEIIDAIASCEKLPDRCQVLRRHARSIWDDSRRTILNHDDLSQIEGRLARVEMLLGPVELAPSS